MNKIALLLTLFFLSAQPLLVQAAGPYVGAGVGSAARSQGQVGARVYTGYQLDKRLGVELGYASYANSSSEKWRVADVVGKASLPLGKRGVSVYALGGVAFVKRTARVNQGKDTQRKWRPKLGAGVSYAASQKLATGFEYSRIQGTGYTKAHPKALPNADMVAFTLTYNFD